MRHNFDQYFERDAGGVAGLFHFRQRLHALEHSYHMKTRPVSALQAGSGKVALRKFHPRALELRDRPGKAPGRSQARDAAAINIVREKVSCRARKILRKVKPGRAELVVPPERKKDRSSAT